MNLQVIEIYGIDNLRDDANISPNRSLDRKVLNGRATNGR
jgi:hypothetical protein